MSGTAPGHGAPPPPPRPSQPPASDAAATEATAAWPPPELEEPTRVRAFTGAVRPSAVPQPAAARSGFPPPPPAAPAAAPRAAGVRQGGAARVVPTAWAPQPAVQSPVPPAVHPVVQSPVPPVAPRPETPAGRGGVLAALRTADGSLDVPVVALAGVVAALVLAAFVTGFTVLGGGSTVPTAQQPAPHPTTTTQHAGQAAATRTFTSPTRNVTCALSTDEARCGIADLNEKPAAVDGCDGTVGYVVQVRSDGSVDAPCVPHDQQPDKASGGVKVLAYGKKLTAGNLVCESRTEGMRCTDTSSGKGFNLARAGIATF